MDINSVSEIIGDNPAIMIYFFSPQCIACESLRPKVKKLISDNFPKMKYYEVNAANRPDLTSEVQVYSAPTILVFFDSKEFIRESKYISVPQLGEKINRYYNLLFD